MSLQRGAMSGQCIDIGNLIHAPERTRRGAGMAWSSGACLISPPQIKKITPHRSVTATLSLPASEIRHNSIPFITFLPANTSLQSPGDRLCTLSREHVFSSVVDFSHLMAIHFLVYHCLSLALSFPIITLLFNLF